jgi:hypothetical protein
MTAAGSDATVGHELAGLSLVGLHPLDVRAQLDHVGFDAVKLAPRLSGQASLKEFLLARPELGALLAQLLCGIQHFTSPIQSDFYIMDGPVTVFAERQSMSWLWLSLATEHHNSPFPKMSEPV